MGNVYQALNVPTIVNARGAATRLSGAPTALFVREAMFAAGDHCVDMAALQSGASKIIADITGAEAGIVTSGAAAGLLLASAACMTGLDPGKMNLLPDTSGMKNEVIVARSHRNGYDHAIRTSGAKLIEVGLADRFAGTGVRDTEPWEYAAAVTPKTAAILYVAHPNAMPALSEVAAIAKAQAIPLIVDAAAQLPPVSNLKRFIAEGADLVVNSGGKMIGGPQASGLLFGRRDLVGAAVLQMLDLDIPFCDFEISPALLDKSRLVGLPHHGIGRVCKVGKEQVVGLLTALTRFVEAEEVPRRAARCRALGMRIANPLRSLNALNCSIEEDGFKPGLPSLRVEFAPDSPVSPDEMVKLLRSGKPRIECDGGDAGHGRIKLNLICLREEDPELIAGRIHDIFKSAITQA